MGGVAGGDRTRDLQVHGLALYRLSYDHHVIERDLVPPAGVGPAPWRLEGARSSTELRGQGVQSTVPAAGVGPATLRLKVDRATSCATPARRNESPRPVPTRRPAAYKAAALPTELRGQGERAATVRCGSMVWVRRDSNSHAEAPAPGAGVYTSSTTHPIVAAAGLGPATSGVVVPVLCRLG